MRGNNAVQMGGMEVLSSFWREDDSGFCFVGVWIRGVQLSWVGGLSAGFGWWG